MASPAPVPAPAPASSGKDHMVVKVHYSGKIYSFGLRPSTKLGKVMTHLKSLHPTLDDRVAALEFGGRMIAPTDTCEALGIASNDSIYLRSKVAAPASAPAPSTAEAEEAGASAPGADPTTRGHRLTAAEDVISDPRDLLPATDHIHLSLRAPLEMDVPKSSEDAVPRVALNVRAVKALSHTASGSMRGPWMWSASPEMRVDQLTRELVAHPAIRTALGLPLAGSSAEDTSKRPNPRMYAELDAEELQVAAANAAVAQGPLVAASSSSVASSSSSSSSSSLSSSSSSSTSVTSPASDSDAATPLIARLSARPRGPNGLFSLVSTDTLTSLGFRPMDRARRLLEPHPVWRVVLVA